MRRRAPQHSGETIEYGPLREGVAFMTITAQRVAVDYVNQLTDGVLTIANHIRWVTAGSGNEFVGRQRDGTGGLWRGMAASNRELRVVAVHQNVRSGTVMTSPGETG